ncbi:hypothetical protein GCM10022210_49320 [Mucilaginibacter dorajii]|uniref:Lipoprotein n=2 Tax=Mucilaginibacter dorajii TaxID=692994 RepID=A0ABP7QZF9_9SPHI
MQEVQQGDQRFFAYLNDETGSIYLNDFQTKKIIKKIQIQGADLKKYKKAFQGLYYHNKDTIFLFSYTPKVTMINDRGKILRIYSLPKEKGEGNKLFFRGFYVSTSIQPYLFENRLFINSIVVGDVKSGESRKVQMILDLKTGRDSIGKVCFPDAYQNKNYGGLHYDIYSVCYNPKFNIAVYSFPAHKKVILSNLFKNNIVNVLAESQFINDFTLYDEDQYKDAVSEPVGEYFMTTPTYGSIFYDKYRDVYYRLALLPVKERNVNYEQKNPPTKNISLIVFDKDFKYLGEKLLEKNRYWSSNAFVSKEGLNIQNRTNSDSTLNFTTFGFQQIPK